MVPDSTSSLQKEQKIQSGNGPSLGCKSGRLEFVRLPLDWNKSITTGTRGLPQILVVMT